MVMMVTYTVGYRFTEGVQIILKVNLCENRYAQYTLTIMLR